MQRQRQTDLKRRVFGSGAFILAAIIVVLSPARPALAADLEITDNGRSAGYFTLAWPDCAGERFTLQMNAGQGWRTIYQGPDRARAMSGLRDGEYRFRLQSAVTQNWSPSLSVNVTHHSLERAFALFGIGGVVFLALIIILAAGQRRLDVRG